LPLRGAIIEEMQSSKTTVSRPLVGFLALGLLSASLFLTLFPHALSGAAGPSFAAAGGRIGIVLAALWVALPSRNRQAAWANVRITAALPVILAVLAMMRVPLRILLPLAAVTWFAAFVLRPRPRQRPERPFSE
jgi:hypothetical protein